METISLYEENIEKTQPERNYIFDSAEAREEISKKISEFFSSSNLFQKNEDRIWNELDKIKQDLYSITLEMYRIEEEIKMCSFKDTVTESSGILSKAKRVERLSMTGNKQTVVKDGAMNTISSVIPNKLPKTPMSKNPLRLRFDRSHEKSREGAVKDKKAYKSTDAMRREINLDNKEHKENKTHKHNLPLRSPQNLKRVEVDDTNAKNVNVSGKKSYAQQVHSVNILTNLPLKPKREPSPLTAKKNARKEAPVKTEKKTTQTSIASTGARISNKEIKSIEIDINLDDDLSDNVAADKVNQQVNSDNKERTTEETSSKDNEIAEPNNTQ